MENIIAANNYLSDLILLSMTALWEEFDGDIVEFEAAIAGCPLFEQNFEHWVEIYF